MCSANSWSCSLASLSRITPPPARISGRRALADDVERPGDRLGRAGRAPVQVPRALFGVRRLHVAGADPQVVRHVDVHRAGPPLAGDLERLREDLRQVLDAVRLPAALDDRLDDAGEVGRVVPVLLLQRAAVVLGGRHLTGDGDERARVVERVAHRDRQQHRARPGARVDRDRDAGQPEVRVGHVAGRGLDPRPHEADVVLPPVHPVQEPDRSVACVPEQVRRLFLDQVVDDEVAASHLGHGKPPPWDVVDRTPRVGGLRVRM